MIHKPGQTQEEAVIEFLVAEGFKPISEEEQKTPWFAKEMRDNLRIFAWDDTSIPAPNEDAELRAMGIDPSIIVDREASSG